MQPEDLQGCGIIWEMNSASKSQIQDYYKDILLQVVV